MPFFNGNTSDKKEKEIVQRHFCLLFFFSSSHSSEINAVMVTGNCWQCSISWIHYKLLKTSIVLKLFLNFRERKVFLWLLGRFKAVQHQYFLIHLYYMTLLELTTSTPVLPNSPFQNPSSTLQSLHVRLFLWRRRNLSHSNGWHIYFLSVREDNW